jgi:hypothetical protein
MIILRLEDDSYPLSDPILRAAVHHAGYDPVFAWQFVVHISSSQADAARHLLSRCHNH